MRWRFLRVQRLLTCQGLVVELLMKRAAAFLMLWISALVFLPLVSARAELPPSAYEARQQAAPEYLKIQILRVEMTPAADCGGQQVTLMALIEDVERTASHLKKGDFINIRYTVADHPKGWVGPGEVPIPDEKGESVAYLSKIKDPSEFAPAAGRMSFSNF